MLKVNQTAFENQRLGKKVEKIFAFVVVNSYLCGYELKRTYLCNRQNINENMQNYAVRRPLQKVYMAGGAVAWSVIRPEDNPDLKTFN